MYDFTKEELDYMSDILKVHINDYPTLTNTDKDFLNKLQSMIDNYCDHDHKKTIDQLGMSFIEMCHNHEHKKCSHGVDYCTTENLKTFCDICGKEWDE